MTKVSKDSIRAKIKEILFLYDLAKNCHKITNYFVNPTKSEEKEILKNHRNIQLVNFVFWRTHIIELAKLVVNSKSQEYNVFTFLDKLKNSELNNDNLNERINLWEEELNSHKETISKIKALRDQAYAHTDRKYRDILNNNSLRFKEIESLYGVIEDIIVTIYGLYGDQVSTDLEFNDGDIHLMSAIVDRNKWLTHQFFNER